MRILNLTMHAATAPQTAEGVVEPDDKQAVKALLLFQGMPSVEEIAERAEALVQRGIRPLYAFSERRSVEEEVDGEVVKKNIFVHLGFVG